MELRRSVIIGETCACVAMSGLSEPQVCEEGQPCRRGYGQGGNDRRIHDRDKLKEATPRTAPDSSFYPRPPPGHRERFLCLDMHASRHARDYERLVQHSESPITWAAITLLTHRIARGTKRAAQRVRSQPFLQ